MRQVAILGIGQTKIDEHWDLSLREIGGNAALAAMHAFAIAAWIAYARKKDRLAGIHTTFTFLPLLVLILILALSSFFFSMGM